VQVVITSPRSAAEEQESALRYCVLGQIEVERDGVQVAIGGPQQRRLLGALLVQRDRVVSIDRLVEVLWRDTAPQGAARSTMTYVSRLRACLGDGAIATLGAGYRLERSAATCDADDFEALIAAAEHSLPDRAVECYEAALALWRGDPLGDVGDDWWALAEATRLRELRAVAREQRAAALVAIGHHARAIPDLEALALDEPGRERTVALLMQALHASGRPADALRCFRSFRAQLAEDTGFDPSPELVALDRSIAGGDALTGAVSMGRPLRGYVLHEVVGEGKFGRVYSATQPGTGRLVAIKAIRPDLADDAEFIRRFDAEAKLVARLEHPHVVPLYDYWREPGGAYLVFRLLTGGTAYESVVAGGPWSLAKVSRLVDEIGGALIVAHAAGVIHRDVRAANVLLDIEGAAYLSDFGIATSDGTFDVADDVHCFGWLAWELLSGAPSSGRTGSRPPALLGRVPNLPAGLDAVLVRATAHDAGYTSMAEFVLGWRAAVDTHDGAVTPMLSDERLAVDSARRLAAQRLARAEAAGVNPYKGLRAFDEADAAAFFGRSEAVDELVGLISSHRMVTVVGASGSGKSSVVRAGIVPRLRADGSTVVVMVPGDDPFAALRQLISEVATSALPSGEVAGVLGAVAGQLGDLVIVVDQLEECWTRTPEEARESFLAALVVAVEDRSLPVRVVTTVRADLLDRPLQHPLVGHLTSAATFVLGPMAAGELDDAIVLPAASGGVYFDDAVVAQLVAETTAQPGGLPLLQFALAELYDRRADGRIRADGLTALGGMTGAVGRRAESLYASLDKQGRTAARELFGRLVIPGDRAVDSRRRARLTELSPAAQAVASRFVDARLLVTDRDQSTREPTIEVAHEALLTRWDRLAGWIADDRRWLAQLQHLAAAARLWDEGGRLDGDLYRGSRLEAAIEAVDADGRTVSAVERDYVEAGRAARDADFVAARRTTRRLRGLLAGVAIALVFALVAGTVALIQRRRADDSAADAIAAAEGASIEALVGRAEAIRSTQRDTAALLAVEAFRMADTSRTRSALFGTFTNQIGSLDSHRIAQDFGPPGIVLPDGETALVALQDGRIRTYDLDTGTLGEPWELPGRRADPYPVLTSSADGRKVAQLPWTDDRGSAFTFGIFDVASGRLTTGRQPIAGQVSSATFSTDGQLVVAGVDFAGDGSSPGLALIEASSGEQLASFSTLDAPDVREPLRRTPVAAALPPDRFVVGSDGGTVWVLDRRLEVVETLRVPPYTSTWLQTIADGTVVGSGVHGVVRFDPQTGTVLWQQLDYAQTCVNMRVIEEAGGVFCGSRYGALAKRDLATGVVVGDLDAQNGGAGGPLWPARHGTELVNFGNNEPIVARWRLDGSGPITTLGPPGWAFDFLSPNGRHATVNHAERPANEDDQLSLDYDIVDTHTGRLVNAVDGILAPTWVDDDTIIGGIATDDGLRVAHVELQTGQATADGELLETAPDAVAYEPGKARMLLQFRNDDGSSTLWPLDVETGLRTEPTIRVDDLSWATPSVTGDRIAVTTSGGVVIYDGMTGEELGAIRGENIGEAYLTVADQLFVVTSGGELVLYDIDTFKPIRTFGGSLGFILEVTGTRDGSLIVTRDGDRSVSVYDVTTGIRLGAPIPIPADDELLGLSIAHDGSIIAFGGGIDNGYQVWDLNPQHWVGAACRLAGRNLTRQEWETNIGNLAAYRPTCPQFPPDASS
jgi:DNA-binding SARP family transcriptional activator/WD40 repeat protein